ncbi:MAG: formate dehydrogenase major subunit, partial [Nocardioidaceae bacterium]|nr:formate dehydrogenase major subunit [Nocardioidaceae bacterium]
MAECHPVGFQWVMEAKLRGATIIHVDPRFTRTSAVADIHASIRAGTDIAFLGGLVNHVLSNDLDFREYVVAYTNAPAIVSDEYRDTEDLDGLFSGFDEDTRHYDPTSWHYANVDPDRGQGDTNAGDSQQTHETSQSETAGSGGPTVGGKPDRDDTLQHPMCVFQILKRHFARYTPDMVNEVCGIPPEQFAKIADALVENSGRERTTAFCYAVGWTHHVTGAQMIRTASILQLLLGNIGRPGGGILALRGHAS